MLIAFIIITLTIFKYEKAKGKEKTFISTQSADGNWKLAEPIG